MSKVETVETAVEQCTTTLGPICWVVQQAMVLHDGLFQIRFIASKYIATDYLSNYPLLIGGWICPRT